MAILDESAPGGSQMLRKDRPVPASVAASAPVAFQTADVKESLTSASFPITGRPLFRRQRGPQGDGHDSPARGTFSHSASPKLQAEAFFKAALRNSTDYPCSRAR